MRATGIQVADDAVGALGTGEELAAFEGEIGGDDQQADADQGKQQALEDFTEA